MQRSFVFICLLIFPILHTYSQGSTYAEMLGYPKGARVLILHVDDVGMSRDSNEGAIEATGKGVATSMSVMMPCPWVPGFIHYLKEHPDLDAGLHLTLTSEWKEYRWGPVAGRTTTPGLVDAEGAMWRSVKDVVSHASPDEVEREIREQLQRAKNMGFQPTHLDSHMGTLFASPGFLERYVKVGIENKIPVMFPGGHDTMISKSEGLTPDVQAQLRTMGKKIWDSGLPVLDDLHNVSYDFDYPKDEHLSDEELRRIATSKYEETIRELKPGLTMVIMHCTDPGPIFKYITTSGRTRNADRLAMTDPAFRKFLKDEKIILTTWREVMRRRSSL